MADASRGALTNEREDRTALMFEVLANEKGAVKTRSVQSDMRD